MKNAQNKLFATVRKRLINLLSFAGKLYLIVGIASSIAPDLPVFKAMFGGSSLMGSAVLITGGLALICLKRIIDLTDN